FVVMDAIFPLRFDIGRVGFSHFFRGSPMKLVNVHVGWHIDYLKNTTRRRLRKFWLAPEAIFCVGQIYRDIIRCATSDFEKGVASHERARCRRISLTHAILS